MKPTTPIVRCAAAAILLGCVTPLLHADPLISIKTDNAAIVYHVNDGNELTQYYLGTAADAPTSYDTSADAMLAPYPTGNGTSYAQPGLRATHADGNTSTSLVYVNHQTSELGNGVRLTKIQLKDGYYPFFVDFYIRSYGRENIFEQWVQIYHSEPAPVTIYELAIAGLMLNESTYWQTQLVQTSKGRPSADETQSTPNIQIIKSLDSKGKRRSAWPFFLVSPNSQAQPFSGPALAGVVLTTGEFAIWSELAQAAFEKPSERRQLRILAGTNPIASGKTLQANQRLTTPAMIYTYTDQGVQSVSIRFREWAERYCAGSNSDLRFLLTSLPTW